MAKKAAHRMQVLAILNLKGGVGKTVTSVHLGAGLAFLGCRTLLIDMDLQHGLSSYFDVDVRSGATTAQVLLDGAEVKTSVREVRENLFLLPATAHMEIVDRELPHLSGADLRLRRALNGVPTDTFDVVLIDCPSGWGAIARNATLAASGIVIPIDCEPAALRAGTETGQKVEELCDFYAQDAPQQWALLTHFRQTKIARSVENQTLKIWPGHTFQTRVRRAERINELSAFRETVFDDARLSPVREDYNALTQEVVKMKNALR